VATTAIISVEAAVLAWATTTALGDATLGYGLIGFAVCVILLAATMGRRWAGGRHASLVGVGLLAVSVSATVLPVSAIWPGGVRFATFGFTVIGALPVPAFDVIISPRGVPRFRIKSHRVTRADAIAAKGDAEELIVAIGWNEAVQLDADAAALPGVRQLATGAAVERFETLRRQGKRVALLLHSTC
jgi:hypothetical protein